VGPCPGPRAEHPGRTYLPPLAASRRARLCPPRLPGAAPGAILSALVARAARPPRTSPPPGAAPGRPARTPRLCGRGRPAAAPRRRGPGPRDPRPEPALSAPRAGTPARTRALSPASPPPLRPRTQGTRLAGPRVSARCSSAPPFPLPRPQFPSSTAPAGTGPNPYHLHLRDWNPSPPCPSRALWLVGTRTHSTPRGLGPAGHHGVH
jgi:hypothetical protein